MFDYGVGIKDPLFFVGIVEDCDDVRAEGRVKVRAFGIHGTNDQIPTEDLPWALCVRGDYDPNGTPNLGIPGGGSWVFGVFMDGRGAQQPMILGLIPTQVTTVNDPNNDGVGYIPGKNAELLNRGSEPENTGQPQNDRLSRAENLDETYILQQEVGRAEDVEFGGDADRTWSEPNSAYAAKYPFNRVYKTAHHSIELDDSPGAERIMIHHKEGSYIQIDSRGTKVNKTASDQFDVMDKNSHVVIGAKGGGFSTITINGNSYVKVNGDKVEEITGDLQTLVHGNHMLSVGGQSTINGGEQVQIRAADVKVHANVGTMSIKAGKELNISAGGLTGFPPKYGAISLKAEKIMVDATDKLHLRGNTQVNIQAIAEMNISSFTINQLSNLWSAHSSAGTFISATGVLDLSATIDVAIAGGVTTNISSPFINVGTAASFVNLAMVARPPVPASIAVLAKAAMATTPNFPFIPGSPIPEFAFAAAGVEAPEPVTKNTNITPVTETGSSGSGGVVSQDDTSESSSTNTQVFDANNPITAATQSSITPLLDLINSVESAVYGYDSIVGLVKTWQYPSKKITEMTIGEILDWQDSIDSSVNSEAVGRYQIMEDTLRGYDNGTPAKRKPEPPFYKSLASRAGLSSSDLYSPENQDKLAGALIQLRGLEAYLADKITETQFANNLAHEWAGLPLVSGPNKGLSRYRKVGTNKAAKGKVQEVRRVIREVKARELANRGETLPNADTDTTGGAR